ncbi:uncharacterized protein LOC129708990 [Leucoraja erinacea]|uniref:uncharacterized protein LOC129708990 n=1 Tax=Leucoraja erinaceus TaxID=7782 RepID=UPI002457A4B7|nr:uncharacterized protein LOC129708990 [Leucoraja erinacea]
MWVPILLICSLPVSGVLWGDGLLSAAVGKAITTDCHYDEKYGSNTKYWCRGKRRQCSLLVETDGKHGRSGRMSITDNPARGIFTVTVEDLIFEDNGWYSCGITTPGEDQIFSTELRVYREFVSAPVLRFASPANVSCVGGSVSVSCESYSGTRPINYTWFEKAPSTDLMTSNTSVLDIHCQSLQYDHHQYYCTAANIQGETTGEVLDVETISMGEDNCSYVMRLSNSEYKYHCGRPTTESASTQSVNTETTSDIPPEETFQPRTTESDEPGLTSYSRYHIPTYISVMAVLLPLAFVAGLFWYLKRKNREFKWITYYRDGSGDNQVKVSTSLLMAKIVKFLILNVAFGILVGLGKNSPSERCLGKGPNHLLKISLSLSHCIVSSCYWLAVVHDVTSCSLLPHCYLRDADVSESSELSDRQTSAGLVTMDKTMWIPILLISSLPVSGAVRGKREVRGVVGRAITIDCHYAAEYRSYTKYWCRWWTIQCTVLLDTNGQHGRSGRVSITDNPTREIFTVTVEDLQSGDTGWYSCGVYKFGWDPMFDVHLQVYDEPVSAPVLRYLSPANASRLGGSVSVSCASASGSLPIHYTWCEKNEHRWSTILSGNQLDLSCEILAGQHRQYYCTASNNLGTKPSEILNVKVFKGEGMCSYVTEMNNAVSGALWAESEVRGVLGRAITIDCHYAAVYRSHTKYWCRGTSRQCTHVGETNGKSGRASFTDNPARGIFTVTVEDLHSADTGWYSCGITAPGEPTFKVYLQISEEPVSVPVLGFLSPANVSCLGGSLTVTVSCESLRGSLPISYIWYEKAPSGDSKISDNNALDLHCQSFKHQHHQYFCTASNQHGSKSSEMVNVSISSSDVPCSFLIKINSTVTSHGKWGAGCFFSCL